MGEKVVMYTEIHLTKEQGEKLKKWEKETGEDAEELLQSFLVEYIKDLE